MGKKESLNDVNKFLRQGLNYIMDFKFDKALAEYDKALEIQPKNIDALLLKGEVLFGTHNYKKAIETFNKVPKNKLPSGYKNLIDYIKNNKGENSGYYNVFKKDNSWEYVYIESNIFKRLQERFLDDLKFEVIKRGLIWKGIDRSLLMKSNNQNKLEKCLTSELLYDFDNNYNNNNTPRINNNTLNFFDGNLKSNNEDYILLNNMGFVLLKLGKIDESIDCLNKALDINPNDYYAWFNKGFAHINNKEYNDGKKCLFKSLELADFSVMFKEELSFHIFELGWSLYESEKYNDSITCYDICIEFNPTISNFYNCKAISLDCMNEYDKALEFYDNALELDPNDGIILKNKQSAYKNKIYCLLEAGNYEECNSCCDDYLKYNPANYNIWDLNGACSNLLENRKENLDIYKFKALSLHYLNRFDEALEFYNKALEINPNDEYTLQNIEVCYLDKISNLIDNGEYMDANSFCDVAINNYPNTSNFYNMKAIALENLLIFDEAVEFYDKALKINPNDEVIKNNKLTCLESEVLHLFHEEKYDECIICCEKYLKIDKENIDVLVFKGASLRLSERFDEALEFYDKVLDIKHDNAIIYNKKSCIISKFNYLIKIKDYVGACRLCDLAIEFISEGDSYYDYFMERKCMCLAILNKFDESIELFNKCYEIRHEGWALITDKASCINKAAFWLMGYEDYNKACELYEKCRDMSLDMRFDYYLNQSRCYKELNRFDEALECINRSFAADDEGYLNQKLIMLEYFEDKLNYLQKSENIDEINECLNEALKLYPTHEYFINLRDKLD